MKKTIFTLLLAGLVGLAAAPVFAQDKAAEKPAEQAGGSLPDCIHSVDGGFNEYVNLDRLGFAWSALDAEMMTDAVLQLAEGERVLLRKHKAIDTDELAAAAAKVAAQNNDKDSLERLGKFAAARGNAKLSQQITAAQKMSGASRSLVSLTIGVGMVTPRMLEVYEGVDAGIRRSGIFGDVASLEEFKKLIDRLKEEPGLDEALADDLDKKVTLAMKTAGPARGDSGSGMVTKEALDKLAVDSRALTNNEIIGGLTLGAMVIGGGLAYQDAQNQHQTQTRRENMLYGAVTGRGPYGQVRPQVIRQQPVFTGGTPGWHGGGGGGGRVWVETPCPSGGPPNCYQRHGYWR